MIHNVRFEKPFKDIPDKIFKKVWDQTLKLKKIDIDNFSNPKQVLLDTLVYYGEGVKIPKKSPHPSLHKIIQYLFGSDVHHVTWWMSKFKKAFFEKPDPIVFERLQEEFQLIFTSIWDQIEDFSREKEPLLEAFLGNLVALIPYTYPKVGKNFEIPFKKNDKWIYTQFVIDEKIDLSPKMLSSPIDAFVLKSAHGDFLLSFIGTTYPTGDGFVAGIIADATPGFSVGHAAYLYAKKRLKDWFEDKCKVHLYGVSLGGALCFHVLRHHCDKIQSIHTYNPPGLYYWNWKQKYNSSDLRIKIYYQENDFVSTTGIFPEGKSVEVLRVIGHKKLNTIQAHIRVLTGSEEIALLKSDPSFENKRFCRNLLMILHLLFGTFIFAVPILSVYLGFSLVLKIEKKF